MPLKKDAAALHCPNCGAPAKPGALACPYCHAALATVTCPKCYALMFEGSFYCPSCGTRRPGQPGVAAKAPCPHCRGQMNEVAVADGSLLECTRCHGIWLDAPTFEHICKDRAAQSDVIHRFSAVDRSA